MPTPLDPTTNTADLSYVEQAARDIVPLLRRGNLVVLESTVPPGTTRDVLAPILAESGLVPGLDIYVAHCPERVLPGRILVELEQNDRLAGGLTPTLRRGGRRAVQRRSSRARSCAPTRRPPRWSR